MSDTLERPIDKARAEPAPLRRYREPKEDRVVPPRGRPTLRHLFTAAERVLGLEQGTLGDTRSFSRHLQPGRAAVAWLAVRVLGYTCVDVASLAGFSRQSAALWVARCESLLAEGTLTRETVSEIEQEAWALRRGLARPRIAAAPAAAQVPTTQVAGDSAARQAARLASRRGFVRVTRQAEVPKPAGPPQFDYRHADGGVLIYCNGAALGRAKLLPVGTDQRRPYAVTRDGEYLCRATSLSDAAHRLLMAAQRGRKG